MTLPVLIKNATLTPINVAWILTALIGPSAARSHHVLMERVTVMIILSVKVHLLAAVTTVEVNRKAWTAVMPASLGMFFIGFVIISCVMDGDICSFLTSNSNFIDVQ